MTKDELVAYAKEREDLAVKNCELLKRVLATAKSTVEQKLTSARNAMIRVEDGEGIYIPGVMRKLKELGYAVEISSLNDRSIIKVMW